jgi:hypothetical protein
MRRLALLVGVVAASAGCVGPRAVQQSATEGVIALPSNSDGWPHHHRRTALEMIAKHVGPDYEIVSEQEVVTGHTTINDQKTDREMTFNSAVPFLPAEREKTTTTVTQVPQTEWHIAYRKRQSPPAAAQPVTQTGAAAPAGR